MKYPSIKNVFKVGKDKKYDTNEMDEYADLLKYSPVAAFEKIDGMNIRVMYENGKLEFRGRTDKALLPKGLVDKLHKMFDGELEWFEKNFPEGVILYGEGIGPKIQGNKYDLKDYNFILFDVMYYNNNEWKWANKISTVSGIADSLGIKSAKKIFGSVVFHEIISFFIYKNETFPKSVINENVNMEGFVIVPVLPLYDDKGNRIIFKFKFKYV